MHLKSSRRDGEAFLCFSVSSLCKISSNNQAYNNKENQYPANSTNYRDIMEETIKVDRSGFSVDDDDDNNNQQTTSLLELIPEEILQQYYIENAVGKRAVSPVGRRVGSNCSSSSRQSSKSSSPRSSSSAFLPIVKIEVDIPLLQCSLCPLNFQSEEDLDFHTQFHKTTPRKNQRENSENCSGDDMKSVSARSKSCQITLCAVCGEDCRNQTQLKLHMKTHMAKENCGKCNETDGVSGKIKGKNDQKVWNCSRCEKFFKKEFALKIHFTKQHVLKKLGLQEDRTVEDQEEIPELQPVRQDFISNCSEKNQDFLNKEDFVRKHQELFFTNHQEFVSKNQEFLSKQDLLQKNQAEHQKVASNNKFLPTNQQKHQEFISNYESLSTNTQKHQEVSRNHQEVSRNHREVSRNHQEISRNHQEFISNNESLPTNTQKHQELSQKHQEVLAKHQELSSKNEIQMLQQHFQPEFNSSMKLRLEDQEERQIDQAESLEAESRIALRETSTRMVIEPKLEYFMALTPPPPVNHNPRNNKYQRRRQPKQRQSAPPPLEQNQQPTFQCLECPKSFASPKILRLHLRSHAVKKIAKEKFACFFCPKEFASKLNLSNHTKKNHSNVKDGQPRQEFQIYRCDFCDKTTGSIKYLKIHQKLHTQGMPWCDICDLSFATKGCLGRHRQKFHYEGFH